MSILHRLFRWFKKIFGRQPDKGGKPTAVPEPLSTTAPSVTFTVPFAGPVAESKIVKPEPRHGLGIGHSMTRLKEICGHSVRGATMTRAFKEAFYREYGWRLR